MGGVRAEVAKLVLGHIEYDHATLGLVAHFSLHASNSYNTPPAYLSLVHVHCKLFGLLDKDSSLPS